MSPSIRKPFEELREVDTENSSIFNKVEMLRKSRNFTRGLTYVVFISTVD